MAAPSLTETKPAVEMRLVAALDELLARYPSPIEVDRTTFLRAQYDLGLAWVHFEPGCGGLGLAGSLQGLITARLGAACAPTPGSGDYVGLHQVAAAINAVGTPAQKQRFLPGIFDGSESWCQLFSEPGAGSDLAGLSTIALQDGDEWTITGQKVWTSGAHLARWGLLLARTDPDAFKHRGLTVFVCDMSSPGIEIRPLRQADGAAHFSEVFLNDVCLPDELRLGDVAHGWGVAVTALHAEREGIGEALRTPWPEVEAAWRDVGHPSEDRRRILRDEVAGAWIDARLIELLQSRMLATRGVDGSTPLGSLLKLAQSATNQRAASLILSLMGPAGQVGFEYDSMLHGGIDGAVPPPQMLVVRSRAHSIEGGSDEIQRNIIGEQVLGLPGDVRVDKDRPWREVPRS